MPQSLANLDPRHGFLDLDVARLVSIIASHECSAVQLPQHGGEQEAATGDESTRARRRRVSVRELFVEWKKPCLQDYVCIMDICTE